MLLWVTTCFRLQHRFIAIERQLLIRTMTSSTYVVFKMLLLITMFLKCTITNRKWTFKLYFVECRVSLTLEDSSWRGLKWSFIQFGHFKSKQIASKAGHPRSWINTKWQFTFVPYSLFSEGFSSRTPQIFHDLSCILRSNKVQCCYMSVAYTQHYNHIKAHRNNRLKAAGGKAH